MSKWLVKLCLSFPPKVGMPLPYPGTILPDRMIDTWYHGEGKGKINVEMSDETARKEERKYPSGIGWVGHGNVGVAYSIGNYVIKYTNDRSEITSAKMFRNNPLPCVVRIYDIDLIQDEPTIWSITMEKVTPASEDDIHTPEYRDGTNSIRECLRENGFRAGDVRFENVGWNKAGRLVLLDVGFTL